MSGDNIFTGLVEEHDGDARWAFGTGFTEALAGATVARIAARLHLSPGTVRNYLSSAASKLGAANRAQALMTALRLGLLEAPDAPKF